MDGHESMKALIADTDERAESLAYIHPRIRRGAIAAALREAEERGRLKGIEEAAKVAETKPDNYAVQNCCICYGGNSFPGPMKEALECHGEILATRIRALVGKTEEKVG